jgi:hypothetical protein
MNIKHVHWTPICATPNSAAAHSLPLSSLQHPISARLAGKVKILPIATPALDDFCMLRKVGDQDAEDQEAGKADGEWIGRCQSIAVLREVGHGCMGLRVRYAMRCGGTYAMRGLIMGRRRCAVIVCWRVTWSISRQLLRRRAGAESNTRWVEHD